ncbi:IclR family transcriptional regulator [Bordetella avium]|uniref:IclR family transcriptional regulator n=1 Tax=Bordetella avium TaxID=521 RepID=UPI000E0AE393|nr:IclR family transcriptional regulator [Bordetella avium]AZY49179.1 IclR family transcriptional regulator [Bordetella avium]RIQ12327.1 IclR family transcriptional regulator [Bordetella avium]RIQ36045.1 IclR family transcriptional regulator [Bordetella avium]RIQ40127.1 IclR family transcriptional regulator [Bordetella avium]RIQ41710.1 IclR family transcriptional regulator [Bordetella avium]
MSTPDQAAKPAYKAAPADAAKKAAQRGIQSVETGFKILDVLMRAGSALPLSRIAEESALTVANTHYYLVSFQRVGIVQQEPDTGHYGLGTYALKLGVAALEQFDVYKLARPAMMDISARSGHTVFLGVWGNKGPTIVNRVEGGKSQPLLELRVGSVLPLLSSALGRNFAAHLPAALIADLVRDELALREPLADPSRNDVPNTEAEVEDMLARIRAQGFSRCRNTLLPNFTSLSAPVFDLSGTIIAALTVMGPTHLMQTEQQTLDLLKHHAAEISQTAGLYG